MPTLNYLVKTTSTSLQLYIHNINHKTGTYVIAYKTVTPCSELEHIKWIAKYIKSTAKATRHLHRPNLRRGVVNGVRMPGVAIELRCFSLACCCFFCCSTRVAALKSVTAFICSFITSLCSRSFCRCSIRDEWLACSAQHVALSPKHASAWATVAI